MPISASRTRSWFGATLLRLFILLYLTSSCASFSGPKSAAAQLATPTPTPFQPQPGVYDSPFAAPALPQPAPTLTAVPTIRVEQSLFSSPVQVVQPATGGGGVAPANATN